MNQNQTAASHENLNPLFQFLEDKNERIKMYKGAKNEAIYDHFLKLNHDFCTLQQFSDEKVHNFMTVMDKALHKLIRGDLVIGSLKPENDMQNYFTTEFENKSLQRPPFSVSIFDSEDFIKIKKFLYEEFFPVCSLFEYSLKPRKELHLRCENIVPDLPREQSLMSMKQVEDPKEVPHLKEYFEEPIAKETPEAEGEGEPEDHKDEQQNEETVENNQPNRNISLEKVILNEKKRIDKFVEKKLKIKRSKPDQEEL
ncbi:unnamed protein product [Moneuplotes crassus]|uniref:Uncharacterized protein n=1 Tax=Euplotes crassus TaxID=5936 RepID=A0AAD2D441_EUPCR|nr:unnamed protein product [Moneuplotes crassus]